MSRINKWERQRICACGTPYLYSRYLSKGLCSSCMNLAKEARRFDNMPEKFRFKLLKKLDYIAEHPKKFGDIEEALLLKEAVSIMDIGELRKLYLSLLDSDLIRVL